jgi:ribosomal protein L13
MKTFVAKPETVKREWYVVDAADKTLGRLATEIASRLRGKRKSLLLATKPKTKFTILILVIQAVLKIRPLRSYKLSNQR